MHVHAPPAWVYFLSLPGCKQSSKILNFLSWKLHRTFYKLTWIELGRGRVAHGLAYLPMVAPLAFTGGSGQQGRHLDMRSLPGVLRRPGSWTNRLASLIGFRTALGQVSTSSW